MIFAFNTSETPPFDLLDLQLSVPFHLGSRVLGLLAGTATNAFRRQPLLAKGRPGTKVFASLAPLDFQPLLVHGRWFHDPYRYVANGTNPLVLTWNNVHRLLLIPLAIEAVGRTDPHLAAHDTRLFTRVPLFRGTTTRQVVRKVDEGAKVRQLDVLRCLGVLVSDDRKRTKK